MKTHYCDASLSVKQWKKTVAEKKERMPDIKNDENKEVKCFWENKNSAYERGKEHMNQSISLSEGSYLLKHLEDKHPATSVINFKIKMEIRK